MQRDWLLLAASAPAKLWAVWDRTDLLPERLYRPSLKPHPMSFAAAVHTLHTSVIEVPDGLLPITYVDDRSLACLTVGDEQAFGWAAGSVIRWHLDDIPVRHQARVLDTGLDSYIDSLVSETGAAWQKGLDGMAKLSTAYQAEFVIPEITPKAHHRRPFQLACQNVIIGLAAFQYDARIDGTSVAHWLTCDVPHVATSEGSRALAALLLCDAFQSGGTMEIDFSHHPEQAVPASLRRFGRTVGVALGTETQAGASISPAEARELFWQVTPMPEALRRRAGVLVDNGFISVERLCYSLLAPIWTPQALDFLVAVAAPWRLRAILEGGTDPRNEGASFERALMRSALLLETYLRRLDAKDSAAEGDGYAQRVFEDTTHGIRWSVLEEAAAVIVEGFPPGPVPWARDLESDGRIALLPRAHVSPLDLHAVAELQAQHGIPTRVLVAHDAFVGPEPKVILRAPSRLAELDARIERNLVASRLGRS